MAQTIQIKNSSLASDTPATLLVGELAVNTTDKKLYVGSYTGVIELTSDAKTHIDSHANPHMVTATQVGAEPANSNIQSHIATVGSNPHGTDHSQLDMIGLLDTSSTDITRDKHLSNAQGKAWQDHINSTSNPHVTTASQVGALSVTGGDVGNGTDYTHFDADGSLEFVGAAAVFDDLVAAISGTVVIGTGVSVNGAEQRIEYLASANTADYAWTSYQMRHAWKPGSIIKPHIHWEQSGANVPNWLIQYRWQVNGGTKTTAWTNYKCDTMAFTYTSGTINQICHGAGLTPPVGYNISDILQVRVIRDTTNASGLFTGVDAYTGTVSVISNDVHLELNRIGSRTEYTV